MSTPLSNRDVAGSNPVHNSGSIRPTPNVGAHIDPRAGGAVNIGTGGGYAPQNVPSKNGGPGQS